MNSKMLFFPTSLSDIQKNILGLRISSNSFSSILDALFCKKTSTIFYLPIHLKKLQILSQNNVTPAY